MPYEAKKDVYEPNLDRFGKIVLEVGFLNEAGTNKMHYLGGQDRGTVINQNIFWTVEVWSKPGL